MAIKLALLRDFIRGAQHATDVFEAEDARKGCALACQYAAYLLKEITQDYRLSAPLLEIYKGFEDLQKEIRPDIFEPKVKRRQKSRTSRREFTIMFAVALLDTLVELGEPLEAAARVVARGVSNWPELADAPVTEITVINWRKQRVFDDELSRHRAGIKEDMLSHRKSARERIRVFLRSGPPSTPKLD